ncbi:putative Anaphase promoting complex cyclosome subunit 3 [Trypanosoma vivax]|uniref:Bacterial transcriptional activator domain-containing protein n=1 Tax=Trypanosoma vivax (strain Y486) TaxID=1055687 RepID=G0U7W3_TRYVY|nr:hypothetical protein TRVL_07555 [Trypanosoma vivax]KAH8620704.1 putative Anaphase promoting complex cyclosome subunit 3 [Trypanosoma vivax]CCC51971.1 conserved hypothetical protein [Trypanosoma vivax Y486]
MPHLKKRHEYSTSQGLKEVVQESLGTYMYANAIFFAERLYALAPTYDSLHTLAHCYVTSGDVATAYRLLHAHHPFTSPSPVSFSGQSADSGSFSDAPVWKCQYLYGVTCAMTKRYARGEEVLGELDRYRPCSEVKYWLGVCRQRLNRGNADDAFASSAMLNPLNFVAYEEHLKLVGAPRDDVARIYSDSNRMPDMGDSEFHSAPPGVPEPGGTVSENAQRRVKRELIRQYLSPFAAVVSLQWAYKCKEARELLQRESFPERGSGWAVSALAMAHFHDGDVESATKEFARLRQVEPWRLADPVLVYYSTALWQRKDTIAMASLSQVLIDEMPTSPITLCVAANAYSLQGEHKEAVCMLDRAVQVDREFAYAHTLRGYELLSLERKQEAKESFRNAVCIDSNHYIAYAGLGELFVRSDSTDQGRNYFKKAIKINPLPSIMNRYAATYHHCGAREGLTEALWIYEEAIRLHPTNLGARHKRAEVLIALGRYNEAHDELQRLIIECPDEAMLHVTLADCFSLMKRRRDAVECYHKAMYLDPHCVRRIKSRLEGLSMNEQE